MSLFNAVVDSSFGVLVEGDWIQAIHNFCASYRALPGITFPPKYHLVEGHLQQFLERRWQQDCYKGFGLGYWSEQPFASPETLQVLNYTPWFLLMSRKTRQHVHFILHLRLNTEAQP